MNKIARDCLQFIFSFRSGYVPIAFRLPCLQNANEEGLYEDGQHVSGHVRQYRHKGRTCPYCACVASGTAYSQLLLYLDTEHSMLHIENLWVNLICISMDLSSTLHVFIIMLNLFWVVKENSFFGKYQNSRAAFRLTMRPGNKGSLLLRGIGRTDGPTCLSTYRPFHQSVPIIQPINHSINHSH